MIALLILITLIYIINRDYFNNLYISLYLKFILWKTQKETNVSFINRKKLIKTILIIDGEKYDYYIQYNKLLAMKEILVTGNPSSTVYKFHPGLLPKIKASDLQEESFKISIDNQENTEIDSLENFL